MSHSFADHRDAAFSAIHRALEVGFPCAVVTNDMGAHGLEAITQRFPENVINVGIQEQNMVSVAAGLAQGGITPVIYGIASHIVGRAYEQLRLDLAFTNLHALVLSAGPGLTYGPDGPTHQALHEPILLGTLPNLTLYSPTDPDDTYQLVLNSMDAKGIVWISLDKFCSRFQSEVQSVIRGTTVWNAANSTTCIVSYGAAIDLCGDLASAHGIYCLQILQPLPLSKEIADFLINFKRVIFVEEASFPGVLSSQFTRLSKAKCQPITHVVALPILTPLGSFNRFAAWKEMEVQLVGLLPEHLTMGE